MFAGSLTFCFSTWQGGMRHEIPVLVVEPQPGQDFYSATSESDL